MTDRATLQRLATFDHWANRMVLEAARTAAPPQDGSPVGQALAALRHGAVAQTHWLGRITDAETDAALWVATPTVGECERSIAEAATAMTAYLDACTDADLSGEFAYRNSVGDAFRNRVSDVLLHALLHAARHRGEAAWLLGAAGSPAPEADLIHYLRLGEPA